jgi:very-short-patch-repair endonuclease
VLISHAAAKQHGNIARGQALGAGLGTRALQYALATGRLFRVHPGVYAVGRPARAPLELASAAVLACGPFAALSHACALFLWGFISDWPRRIEVSLARGDRRPRGLTVHRPRRLDWARETTVQRGIRATTASRTLLDCAPRLTAGRLASIVADARNSGWLSLDELAATIIRHPQHPGAAPLRRLLVEDRGPTRSEFERAFVAFCESYALPAPRTNARVLGYEIDAWFGDHRLAVELDGWRFHSDRAAFEGDRDRDAELAVHDVLSLRLTWRRLIYAPGREATRLHKIIDARAIITGHSSKNRRGG